MAPLPPYLPGQPFYPAPSPPPPKPPPPPPKPPAQASKQHEGLEVVETKVEGEAETTVDTGKKGKTEEGADKAAAEAGR